MPWVFHCRAHIPTECSRTSSAALYRCGWGPGCFLGWHSTPPQSILGLSWGEYTAPAQSFHRSKLPIWSAASAESGGLCGRDTQAMLADALHHHCTKDLVPWKDTHTSWLEKMHVQALLAYKMVVCSTGHLSSICFFALHLKNM